MITGHVLQQDASGVLLQMESGTYRYPSAWIRDVQKEAAATPHVSNDGQAIPDWAQVVALLANNTWAEGLKQVPAPVIVNGIWQNVPYISFRCAAGGYEVNIFGDLNKPAAIQIGALGYLSQSAEARSNCVAFICSVLANAADRQAVRALNLTGQDVQHNGDMTFKTTLPGQPDSYGGWWVSVYSETALANSHASEAELMGLAQSRTAAAQSAAVTATPTATATNTALSSGAAAAPAAATATAATTTGSGVVTTYGATYGVAGWTREELAAARPVAPTPYPSATGANTSTAGDQATPASTSDRVYPRTYSRTDGGYRSYDVRRR